MDASELTGYARIGWLRKCSRRRIVHGFFFT
jgi:hypothetical protein